MRRWKRPRRATGHVADGGHPVAWPARPQAGGTRSIFGENAAGDVPASLTTMVWNAPFKSWTRGAVMEDAPLNRRMIVRMVDAAAYAQIGIVGLDGQIELEALRLYRMP